MVVFTWLIRLNSKNRLVLPLNARKYLGISDSVLLKLDKNKLVLTIPDGLKNKEGVKISKNCFERPVLCNGSTKDKLLTKVEAPDCGSFSPGSNPGMGPINF